MRKIVLTVLAAVAFATSLGGCKGSAGPVYTHQQLADDFVYRLNFALGYNVDLMKTYTLQSGYIVVYDYDFDSFDAYDLSFYNPGADISSFISSHSSNFYYDLDYIGSNTYEDYWTGTLFSEGALYNRNVLKKKGEGQQDYVSGMATKLVQSFNMSEQSAQKVAASALMIQLMSAKRMHGDVVSEQAYAEVVRGITGTSNLEDIKGAMNGDVSKKNALVKSASQALGMSASDTNALLDQLSGSL